MLSDLTQLLAIETRLQQLLMSEVTAAFAALHLHANDSPRINGVRQHTSAFLPTAYAVSSPAQHGVNKQPLHARRLCLFPDSHTLCSDGSHAAKKADWSAVIGDVFQAVVKLLPAHSAQHAMLVCQQWHNSVTHGLLELRPRILNLQNIAVRYRTFKLKLEFQIRYYVK